jgi:hypothetical protein
MKSQVTDVRVILAPDGFYPQALSWRGNILRVLCVEEHRIVGMQRRFRVRTPEGPYELGLRLDTGAWQICRRPGWLARARAALAAQPRYPLPASRRRTRVPLVAQPVSKAPREKGGSHASRLALVRQ